MTFFSVDVETANTTVTDNALLSVGAVVVNEDLSKGSQFYMPIHYENGVHWNDETLKFWMDQDREVYNACRPDPAHVWRFCPYDVAHGFAEWVRGNTANDQTAIFVANPVAFDKPWIDHLFYTNQVDNPFNYRSLCLRSMHFGLNPTVSWGGDRETWGEFNVEPEIKHHALWDAIAQADEFILMMQARASK